MAKIKVNGIEIYYELHGPENAPVLVLSNGVLMSTASWAFQTPVLSQQYRVLLYDCRGMWQSEHPPGPYTMELHADDLAALLDALEFGPAHIAGISYGAEVSMAFAIKYPERTRSLILASSVSHLDPVLQGFAEIWIQAAKAKDPANLLQVTYPLNFSDNWIRTHRAALEAAVERYKKLDFDGFLELMLCFYNLNLTPELHSIKSPTLVMVGELDILKPRRYSEIIAAAIPNAEFALIPGAGHASCIEQPWMFNALILGFLSQHV